MILPLIEEIIIRDVCDRGVPNKERIVIFVNERVNLAEFGLVLGMRGTGLFVYPIHDNVLWFGEGYVSRGDWIFVYTGPGQAQAHKIPNSDNTSYSVHWGRQYTILGNQEITPFLIKLNGIYVFPPNPLLSEKS